MKDFGMSLLLHSRGMNHCIVRVVLIYISLQFVVMIVILDMCNTLLLDEDNHAAWRCMEVPKFNQAGVLLAQNGGNVPM